MLEDDIARLKAWGRVPLVAMRRIEALGEGARGAIDYFLRMAEGVALGARSARSARETLKARETRSGRDGRLVPSEAGRLWVKCCRLHRELWETGTGEDAETVARRRRLVAELVESAREHQRVWEMVEGSEVFGLTPEAPDKGLSEGSEDFGLTPEAPDKGLSEGAV